MRITKMFTCVIAALTLMYGAGCSDQSGVAQYRMVPGYGLVPAGAVVDPNTGFVTYPQTYAAGTAVYDPAVAYATTAPVYAPVAGQPAPVKVRKVRQRRKARYNRPNVRFANVGAQYAAPGYYQTVTYANPGYGTATLLSNPNVVPSVTTAPVYAGPVYTDPGFVAPIPVPVSAPVATGPVVTVTKYAAASGAEQIAQVAGANCGTPTYRRGRRVKVAKAPRPTGYVPYTVAAPTPAPAPAPAVVYSGVYAPPAPVYSGVYTPPMPVYEAPVVSPVYVDPLPMAPYTPTPLPVEPAPAPVYEAPAEKPEQVIVEKQVVVEKTAEVDIDKLADAVAERLAETLAAAAEKMAAAARPAEPAPEPATQQPIVIQPIIQPIVQSSAPQYFETTAETAGVQVQSPVLPPLEAMNAAGIPFMPIPQEPVVSEPLSSMVTVPGAVSGFEPGVLGAYCPPEICPVPSPVVCGPGQNMSECFTMNDFQLQNTPLQVLRPDVSAPLSFPPAGAVIVSQPVVAQTSQQAEADKYRALTPQVNAMTGPGSLSVRPSVTPPEVSMPQPLGGTTTPPIPATTEIESALDAMLSRDARTPNLK